MSLTPKQAAEVLRYFDRAENGEARRNGWPDKVPLGRIALLSRTPEYSILPDGKPMLTTQEASEGQKYIENPPEPEKSEAYYEEMHRRADTRGISTEQARRELDAEGWE